MNDWPLVVVLSVGLISWAAYGIARLHQREAQAVRDEQRAERERSVCAQLVKEMDAVSAQWRKVETDWKAFQANNRR